MRNPAPLIVGLLLGSAPLVGAAESPAQHSPAALEFFEKKIRPILVDNCYNCHSASTNAKGGLRVDDRNGLLVGGNAGKAIVPGKPDQSLLIKAVSYTDDKLEMPPKKQLTDQQVADLRQWIADGAAWPASQVDSGIAAGKPNPKYEKLKKEHWAWQPLKAVAAPSVRDSAWPKTDIDRFVAAGLEGKNLKPVADADKLALIRRATFDLTGLPPTPEEIAAFVNDVSPAAFEAVVDRLLASPAFGERWGRHWLDVARYGESTGSSRNLPFPHAWKYRDYVIDSINADKPFDRFIQEQVAGDLLPSKSPAEHDQNLIATGFLALGVKDVNQRFRVRYIMDNVDEQIDTVSRSVLGLTASCARCHDHKFDPIPQADYYALAGIFTSSDLCAGLKNKMGGGGLDYYEPKLQLTLSTKKSAPPAADVEKLSKELAQAKKEWDAIRGTPEGTSRGANGQPKQRPFRLRYEALQTQFNTLTDPSLQGEVALGVRDAQEIADTPIRLRGEAEKLGPVVSRGFLSVVDLPGAAKVNPQQSGRLELAQWMTNKENPLTPRVLANRVWQHLFGQGLVKSVDNFGVTGDKPSHPELLDYLATRFQQNGWSIKKLVREIVLTRSYQLSSDDLPAAVAIDPGNQFIWRHAPRRLEAEEIRDATLAASGKLDAKRPDGSAAKSLQVREQRNNGPEAAKFATIARNSVNRSVYLPLIRGWVPTSLEVFDFADQGMVTGSRDATTVSPQALYLLNDPFVRTQSLALAERVLGRSELDDAERIGLAYQLALGRSANGKEIERARKYIADYEADSKAQVASAVIPGANAVTQTPAGEGETSQGGTAVPPPINVDQAVQEEVIVKDDAAKPKDVKAAAWASFCQALLGSAEFRYLK